MRLVSNACRSILCCCLVCPLAQPQQDILLGRWEGKVRIGEGQQLPVTASFTKDGERYGGTISGFDARLDVSITGTRQGGQFTRTDVRLRAAGEVPFKKVEFDNQGINAYFDVRGPQGTRVVRIRLVMKGDTLRGNALLTLGSQVVELNYELRRSLGHLSSPGASRPSVKQVTHAVGTPAEVAKLKKIVAEADPAVRKQLIEAFAGEYPEPQLLRYLREQESHAESQDNGMTRKEKASQRYPAAYAHDHVLLTDLADAYVRNHQIDTAAPLAVRAVELISSTPAPSHLSDEQWAQSTNLLMSRNFTSLGFVALLRAQGIQDPAQRTIEAVRARAPFLKALEYQPKSGYALYGLGLVHYMLGDYSLAETTLAKAAAMNGPVSLEARSMLEEIYRTQHKSLDGLDQVIARAKDELGIP